MWTRTAIAIVLGWAAATRAAPVDCPAGETIDFKLAPRCIGEKKTVVGKVERVSTNENGMVFLDFCASYKDCPLSGVVFRNRSEAVGDLTHLQDRDVAMSGSISTYRGRARVVIDSASQIVAATPVPEPRTAPVGMARDAPPPHPGVSGTSQGQAKAASREVEPEPKRHSVMHAARLVGRKAIVVGRVDHLDFMGNDLVLHFRDGSRESPFVAVVPGSEVATLQSSAERWDLHPVEIEGDVMIYEGVPAIAVRSPSQVRLLNRNVHLVEAR